MGVKKFMQKAVDWGRLKSPWIIHFNAGACNGCDIEVVDALTPRYDVERFGLLQQGTPRHADVLVCTGAVTLQTRDRLKQIYEQMPDPKFVIAVGTCACTGGVFDGCYCVAGGIDAAIPVDAYLPGCAARPEALIDTIVKLLSAWQEQQGGAWAGQEEAARQALKMRKETAAAAAEQKLSCKAAQKAHAEAEAAAKRQAKAEARATAEARKAEQAAQKAADRQAAKAQKAQQAAAKRQVEQKLPSTEAESQPLVENTAAGQSQATVQHPNAAQWPPELDLVVPSVMIEVLNIEPPVTEAADEEDQEPAPELTPLETFQLNEEGFNGNNPPSSLK